MAKFTFVHIEFFVKPSRKELVRINRLFSMLDYNFPEFGFNEKGFYGDWRIPLLPIEAVSNLLNCYGYPNKYRYVEDIYTKANFLKEKSIEENYTKHVWKSYEEYAEELMCDWQNSKPKMIDKVINYRGKNNQYTVDNIFYSIVKKFSRRFV